MNKCYDKLFLDGHLHIFTVYFSKEFFGHFQILKFCKNCAILK